MNKILIVEDDSSLVRTLSEVLMKFRRKILIVQDYDKLEKILDKHVFELAIFDRMLAGKDSLPLLKYLREVSSQTKILILSSKSEIVERVKGLESGADDYLPKPFSLKEFILRAELLLNSERILPSKKIIMSPLVFDLENCELVFPQGERVILRKREADVLRCLSRYRGRLVSRDQIINEVWPHLAQPNDATVDVYIKRLRWAFGSYREMIENRRGMGYRLKV